MVIVFHDILNMTKYHGLTLKYFHINIFYDFLPQSLIIVGSLSKKVQSRPNKTVPLKRYFSPEINPHVGLDIAQAGGWSPQRLFTFHLPYSDLFL